CLPLGVRHHEHVQPGIDRLRAIQHRSPLDKTMAVPVSNNEAVKTHLVFQHFCQQILVAMHAFTMPAVKRRHNSLNTCFYRTHITSSVNITQYSFVILVIAAIYTVHCAAITQEMSRRGNHMILIENLFCRSLTLEPYHHLTRVGTDNFGIF